MSTLLPVGISRFNLRYGTSNRSAHYLQISLMLLFSYLGNLAHCDCGIEFCPKATILELNFNISAVYSLCLNFVNVEIKET